MFIYFDLPYFSDKIRRILITILLLIPIARISSEKSCRCLTNRHSRDSRNCVARQTRLFSRSKRAKVAVKKKRRISRNSPLPSQQLINIFIETFRSISAAFPIARKIPSSFRTWTPDLRRIPLSSIRPNRCNIHQFYPRGFLTREPYDEYHRLMEGLIAVRKSGGPVSSSSSTLVACLTVRREISFIRGIRKRDLSNHPRRARKIYDLCDRSVPDNTASPRLEL